jgi:hypothetical protein
MANEITFSYTLSLTLYAIVINANGQVWNTSTSAFEAPNAANWTHYKIALTDTAATGLYLANFPALTAGNYAVAVYKQAGGTAAVTDAPALGADEMPWSGSAEIPAATLAQVANAVWTNGSRNLTSFAFSTNVSSFSAGLVPTNFNSMVITTTGLVAFDGSRQPAVRNQDGVTQPTYDDCAQGAWTEAFAKEAEDDAGRTWTKQLPDNSAPARTFTLSYDTLTNPVARS